MYFSAVHHEKYMRRCLDLAKMAYPTCRPNPMVGALIVRDGEVVSEGYTQAFGGSHAEVMAIRELPDAVLSESTLYVSLEPCAHHGKTPPCADLIVEKAIPRVVIACRDPFDQVDGRGIDRLKAAGIEVVEGVLESEARRLNKRFFTFHEKKRPYVVLKWAESKDGYIDKERTTGRAQKISGESTDQLVHLWRSEEQGILVGGRTARLDSPRLDVRLVEGPDPRRFVWSSKKLSEEHSLSVSDYEPIDADSVDGVLQALYSRGIQSVLVEGGAQVLKQFIASNSYDELRRVTGSSELGSGVPAPRVEHSPLRTQVSGQDMIEFFGPAL